MVSTRFAYEVCVAAVRPRGWEGRGPRGGKVVSLVVVVVVALDVFYSSVIRTIHKCLEHPQIFRSYDPGSVHKC